MKKSKKRDPIRPTPKAVRKAAMMIADCCMRNSSSTIAKAKQIQPTVASLFNSAFANTYFSAIAATTNPDSIKAKKWGA